MKRTSWVAVAMALGVAASAAAQCPMSQKGGGRGDGPRGGGPGLHMLLRQEARLRELGATDEQVQKLKNLAYSVRKEMITLGAEREQGQLDLQRLMDQVPVDKAALEKIADQLGAVDARMLKQRILAQVDVRELLGADLLNQLRDSVGPRGRKDRDDRGDRRPSAKGKGPGRHPDRGFQRPDQQPGPEAMPEMEPED